MAVNKAPIIVQEADGSPKVFANTLKFPNGTLTDDGGGVVTYVAAGGGGFADWKTIGSGGDYADVQAMIDDTQYRGFFIGDVTEDSDITLDANVYLHLNGYTLTMADFDFVCTGFDLSVKGWGQTNGGEIDYTHTGSGEELCIGGTADTVELNGMTLDNNSSAGSTMLANNMRQIVRNCRLEVANQTRAGIDLIAGDGHIVSDCTFFGPGTSARSALNAGASGEHSATLSNITFTGVWQSTDSIKLDNGVIANNFTFDHDTGPLGMTLLNNGTSYLMLSNFNVIGSQSINVAVTGDQMRFSNWYMRAGIIDLTNQKEISLSNIVTTGYIDLSDSNCQDNQLINCTVTTQTTVGGDNNQMTNCYFIGGSTVNSGADDNGYVNCQFGAVSGGGAATLTINSGSNRTRAGFCASDVIIVDNGTDSEVGFNTIY